PGLRRRLVRDWREQLAPVGADSALDDPAVADMHRAIEALAVEAVRVGIMEEIRGRHGRVRLVERDDDPPRAGVDRDGDLLARRSGLRKRRSGGGREQRGGYESERHGQTA